MTLQVDGTMRHEVTVNIVDVLKALKKKLHFSDVYGCDYSCAIYKGIEGIYRIEDVSHHGSPIWEYILISDKQEDISAFKNIQLLMEYLSPDIHGKKRETAVDG